MKPVSLNLKRSLDSWVGSPLLSFLGPFVRLTGKFLRRDHGIEPAQKILILKFQGMGSLALARPAIHQLRASFPKASITLWCTPSIARLAEGMPELSRIILFNDANLGGALFSMIRALLRFWKEGVDWAFDLEPYSKISSLLTTATCARNRAGFAVESVKLRKWVHTHLVVLNRALFIGEAYQRLFGLLHPLLPIPAEPQLLPWVFPRLPEPAPARATPYITLHPHAGDLSLERRWPMESYLELTRRLLEIRPGFQILITGSGFVEIRDSERLCIDSRVRNLAGKLSIGEMLSLYEDASLAISNDSGPLHLALSTRVPVLALFGPTRPQTYLPPHRPWTVALDENLYCSPCVHHWEPAPCGGDNQCMKRISVAKALEAALSLLEKREPSFQPQDSLPESPSFYPGLVHQRK